MQRKEIIHLINMNRDMENYLTSIYDSSNVIVLRLLKNLNMIYSILLDILYLVD